MANVKVSKSQGAVKTDSEITSENATDKSDKSGEIDESDPYFGSDKSIEQEELE